MDHDFLYYTILNLDSFKAESGPVTSDETTIRALRITDGSLAWQTTTLHPQRDTAFTLRKATLYALLCRSNGTSSRGREKREWQVYALGAHSGETRWHVSLDHFPTLRAEEGKVYVFSDGGILVLDEQTGQEIWRWSAWGGVNWVALIDDMLFVDWHGRGYRRDQRAYALDSWTGQEIWMKKDCALNTLTSDGLFPAIRNKTTRLDLITGEPLWEPPVPPHPRPNQSAIIWSDIIAGHWCFLEYQYVPQDGFSLLRHAVKMMELETGTLVSESILSPRHACDMRFLQQNNGLLYFSPDPGTASNVYPLSAFHLATGEPAWSLDIPISSEPRAPRVHSIAVSAPVLTS